MDNIKIACPAGSGMNFAICLLKPSFNYEVEFLAAGHERSDIIEEVPTLVILRDPYDAIASGTERFLRSSGHAYFKDSPFLMQDENIAEIVSIITREESTYLNFFTNIKNLGHVKVLTFDTLTKNPDLFVKMVAKYFNIKSSIKQVDTKEVLKSVVDSGNANRVPREASPSRKTIDRYMRALYLPNEFKSLKVYFALKEKIEKEWCE
jgi:hypothetical protein